MEPALAGGLVGAGLAVVGEVFAAVGADVTAAGAQALRNRVAESNKEITRRFLKIVFIFLLLFELLI